MSDKNNSKPYSITPFKANEKDLSFLKQWCETYLGTELFIDETLSNYMNFVTTFFETIQPNVEARNMDKPLTGLSNKTALQFLAYMGCNRYLGKCELSPEDINTKQNGMNLLQLSVARGHLETTKILLDKGGNPEIKNAKGESLLFACLLLPIVHSTQMVENKEAIFLLLADRIKNALKEKTESGDTVLHLMASFGYVHLIETILKNNKKLAFVTNNFGHYPIHTAILNGQKAAAKCLLAVEGTEKLTDARGRNPLHYAAMHGNTDMLQICLNALPSSLIDALTNEHQTPLILASIARKPSAVKALLEKGAKRTVQDYTRMNALDYALQSHSEEIIKILQTGVERH